MSATHILPYYYDFFGLVGSQPATIPYLVVTILHSAFLTLLPVISIGFK